MAEQHPSPEPSPIIKIISYLLAVLIVGYLYYWIYQQLEKVDFWVNYIKTPFFIIMGIGLLGVGFLYGMAGLAMYKNAQEMNKKYSSPKQEEEE